jgi:acetoacetate decarboxylase
MGYVKTAAELARIQALLSAPAFSNGEALTVTFTTDPEVVKRLLPPPLEPASEPTGMVTVGSFQGNGVGDYAGGSLYLSARHGDVEGGYAISMWMDAEPAVLYGREIFGEAKKQGSCRIHRGRSRHTATISRGDAYIKLRVEDAGPDRGPTKAERTAFNYRSRTAADGIGLGGPAELTHTVFSSQVHGEWVGRGSIEMHGSAADPVEEIPILSVGDGVFVELDTTAKCRVAAIVPADEFLPYHYGRVENWAILDSSR